ncbi:MULTISPECIES: large conductance mechanosensitive channel protein MscL [Brevibacterium]|jgi:large conductance mechanosensitive channel|uniref:Large-conductance mechanosensitive channel n=2 Tax=Brevibacterium TaxID=1696 RepID=A0A142NPW8_BRELN|nr:MULTISPECIES: large conductance mechanosensitive channel protein MscL [Brevibacterium]AMT94825.1 mechanosensitive ion channel protein MscL [Brevibacterium linens]MCS4593114.1 large conductance mechanosensitive channel protein MscL [Brevibacterium sediminis]TNM56054.1 large conductance mechanosensitive channel protein MscL [Brevibacterium sediminis]GGC30437.1 large conductance mechanosensitive channel protein MscL [Brevibacterium sediminis]
MLKGFRDFILQGNVVELATAVIIGGAFTAIVTAFSDKIINPLIAAVGGAEGPALQIPLKEGVPEATLDIGAVITAAINFLIVAAIVYFIIIVPMNKLNELRKRGAPEEEVPPTTEDLLGDIREILRNQVASPAGPAEGPATDGPIDPNQPPRH